jgi:hypothetical protein
MTTFMMMSTITTLLISNPVRRTVHTCVKNVENYSKIAGHYKAVNKMCIT